METSIMDPGKYIKAMVKTIFFFLILLCLARPQTLLIFKNTRIMQPYGSGVSTASKIDMVKSRD